MLTNKKWTQKGHLPLIAALATCFPQPVWKMNIMFCHDYLLSCPYCVRSQENYVFKVSFSLTHMCKPVYRWCGSNAIPRIFTCVYATHHICKVSTLCVNMYAGQCIQRRKISTCVFYLIYTQACKIYTSTYVLVKNQYVCVLLSSIRVRV